MSENDDQVPFVAIGADEQAPWAGLDLACPDCGGEQLPLRDSKPAGLTFIKCERCGGTWLRGEPDFRRIFDA